MNTKLLSVAMLATLAVGTAKAQVKGVSFTLSPVAEYQWWNKNINLENGKFWGAKAGFGFGQHFELSALYEQSFNEKGRLRKSVFDIPSDWEEKLPGQKVKISRLGGDMKISLLRNTWITPFVTGGAGVQYFRYDPFLSDMTEKYKEEQVYLSWGAGLSVNITPRMNISLQAKDMVFNMDAANRFLFPAKRNKTKRMHNWAAMASVNVYLGGQNPQKKTGMTPSMRDALTSGFVHGIKFVAEPGMAYVSFKDNDTFDDQWFLGGAVGMDFNSMVGVRAFYYQATKKPSKLDLHFNNKLSMYGVNFVTKLNQTRGIAPYLNFGAGYLQTKKGFLSELNNDDFQRKHLFGLLGVGIELPMSKYLSVFGSGNAMLMSNNIDPKNVTHTSQVKANMMYKAGIRLNLGAPVKSYAKQYAAQVEAERRRQNEQINEMREAYVHKMDSLNVQLETARVENDTLKMKAVQAQRLQTVVAKQKEELALKAQNELRLKELAAKAKVADSLKSVPMTKLVPAIKIDTATAVKTDKKAAKAQPEMMTAKEFEQLVNEVVKKVQKQVNAGGAHLSADDMKLVMMALEHGQGSQALAQQIVGYTQEGQPIVRVKSMPAAAATPVVAAAQEQKLAAKVDSAVAARMANERKVNAKTQAELDGLRTMLTEMNVNLAAMKQELAQKNAQGGATYVRPVKVASATPEVRYVETPAVENVPMQSTSSTGMGMKSSTRKSFLRMNRLAAITGLSFGELTSWNVGVRGYLQVSNTDLDFVPEAYVGLGSKATYGFSGNIVYNFRYANKSIVHPYVGLGLGLFKQEKTRFGTNVIMGTSINVLGGKLFVDYSVRRWFKNNQLAVGYRFVF